MSTRGRRSNVTLRAMCGNSVGMVAFVLTYLAVADLWLAVVAGLFVGALGYLACGLLIDAFDL